MRIPWRDAGKAPTRVHEKSITWRLCSEERWMRKVMRQSIISLTSDFYKTLLSRHMSITRAEISSPWYEYYTDFCHKTHKAWVIKKNPYSNF